MLGNVLKILIIIMPILVLSINRNNTNNMVKDYFSYKNVKYLCYVTCNSLNETASLVRSLHSASIFTSVHVLTSPHQGLRSCLHHHGADVGGLLDYSCDDAQYAILEASEQRLLDAVHPWLVLMMKTSSEDNSSCNMEDSFAHLNLSLNSDFVVACEKGLQVLLKGFKYYYRWDFHNLTLRGITVVKGSPVNFDTSLLAGDGYIPGVSAMTKNAATIIDILRKEHRFRINYTIVGRWVGAINKNATKAVSNSMYWRQQDISVTCIRILPEWLSWFDAVLPPVTFIGSKFYYLIPDHGVGEYENRFLTPMSPSVWYCALGASAACGILLGLAARVEHRPTPGYYAIFSVVAATCQQAYDDGVDIIGSTISGQGRRVILLVLGLTSMLLYNYYTSAVVSWLLNAAPPTIASMDGLIKSDLELVFEDIGYTRQWLDILLVLGLTSMLLYNYYTSAVVSWLLNAAPPTIASMDGLIKSDLELVFEDIGYTRQWILLVLGLTSMLLYNYYTSAVVSWLLNAAPPTIASMDGLIKSDLELVFEDIGYTRQWLDGPGFYYFSGFKSPKEDEMRDKKVLSSKRSVPLFSSVEDGIELVRTGKYAYHTEPYTASQVISRRFQERELCALGGLQMLPNSPVYIAVQKDSPYRQFFNWRLMLLYEQGHLTLTRRKFSGEVPACSGRVPRALALGQAAPAFAVLLAGVGAALLLLVGEIMHYRQQSRN